MGGQGESPDLKLVNAVFYLFDAFPGIRKGQRRKYSYPVRILCRHLRTLFVALTDCLGQFVYMLAANYIMGGVIMEGTSQWLDKVGQQVASDRITVSLKAQDDRIAETQPFTGDGYKAENVTVIEKGVLNCFLLNLYAARKTGKPVTKNTGFALVMEPGDKTLEEMIASVDRGLIVGGFSGGEPGANGEFSGVAKNSFYVENGKVVGAVTETMINGNLEKVFRDVTAVSREQVCDGGSVLPWMSCSGIVVSGK